MNNAKGGVRHRKLNANFRGHVRMALGSADVSDQLQLSFISQFKEVAAASK